MTQIKVEECLLINLSRIFELESLDILSVDKQGYRASFREGYPWLVIDIILIDRKSRKNRDYESCSYSRHSTIFSPRDPL